MTDLATRRIRAVFSLGEGAFGESGMDTVTVEGYRMSATIAAVGGVQTNQLDMTIMGLPLDVMHKLTVLNKLALPQERNNYVAVFADDTLAFNGGIKEAWVDAGNPPEVSFTLSAYAGLQASIRPVKATSFRGPVSADTFFATMARLITDGPELTPYGLENNGVTGVLENPYYPGTALQQIQAAARALRCEAVLDTDRQLLVIWPYGKARNGQELLVSADTGLVGYPQFTQSGISFTMLYNPALGFGQRITMKSVLEAANGSWVIRALQHSLSCETPGGPWFTRVECQLLGSDAPVLQGTL